MMKLLGMVAVLSALAVAAAAGGSGAATARTVTVNTHKISGYGTVLVNSAGHTLYAFMKDKRSKVTCTGSCASYWPALKQAGMHKATARGSAKASLIGSDKDPSGGRVVTYDKWPLYAYVGDTSAGTAAGEGKNLNGGRWYMLSPSGALIKKKSSGGGGGGSWG